MTIIQHAMIWWNQLSDDTKKYLTYKYFNNSSPNNLTKDDILYIYNLGKKIYE